MANGYKPGDYLTQFLNQLPQMYYAKKNSELQRERFEYYKTKDAEAVQRKEETKLYNQNLQSWKQIQGFASSLPIGQQSNFIKKQIDILPKEFIQSAGINQWLDGFQELEDNELTEVSIYDNSMYEDSPDKMRQSLQFIKNPTRQRDVKNRIRRMDDAFGKQKNFDINKLSVNQKNTYNALNDLLQEDEKLILEYSMAPESSRTDVLNEGYKNAGIRRNKLKAQLEPFVQLGAPSLPPEFSYSLESVKKITDDPDLLSSFWADPSNNLDEFIASRSKGPEPTPTPTPTPTPKLTPTPKEDKGSMWEPEETQIMVAGPGGVKTPKIVTGGFQLKSDAPSEYKGRKGARRLQSEGAALLKEITGYEDEIEKADRNITAIDKAIPNLSGKSLELAQEQKDKYLRIKTRANDSLSTTRSRYEYIKKPTRGSSVKKKIKN
tara:strand:+ start:816 stop:2120 length:1305 start_codon:yes stop_codon:yes gene_type:complete